MVRYNPTTSSFCYDNVTMGLHVQYVAKQVRSGRRFDHLMNTILSSSTKLPRLQDPAKIFWASNLASTIDCDYHEGYVFGCNLHSSLVNVLNEDVVIHLGDFLGDSLYTPPLTTDDSDEDSSGEFISF